MKKILSALVLSLLTLSSTAHASSMTAEEQESFGVCSVLSYLGYNAMEQYQLGKTKTQNKAFLMNKFADPSDKDNKAFYSDLIDETLEGVYTMPKGKDAEQKEQYSMTFAYGLLSGCAEEMGLDLSKIELD